MTPNHKRKPFDDVRVRRALTLAVDRWHGAPALSKIAIMRTVGGIVFPGSPLAANKEELEQIAGYWPDIEKSRAEAKRLLKEAGVEELAFELLNRDVDQPFKYLATWLVDEWSKVGLKVNQRVAPTGPWFEGLRSGNFEVALEGNCQSVVNPLLDVSKYQPSSVFTEQYGGFDDPAAVQLYQKMLHETDPAQQRDLMRSFEKHTLDDQVHNIPSCGGTGSCRTGLTSRVGKSAQAISSTRIWRRSGSTSSRSARTVARARPCAGHGCLPQGSLPVMSGRYGRIAGRSPLLTTALGALPPLTGRERRGRICP